MRVCRVCSVRRPGASGRLPRLALVAAAASVLLALSIPAFAAVPLGWSLASTVDGGTSSIGTSVATGGGVAIVGAPFSTLEDGGAPTGAVFLYSGGAGAWSAQRLTAPAPIDGGNFGTSVAVSGNLVAVGAPGTPPAAYVFAAEAAGYQSLQTWTDPPADTNQSFGGSVAVLAGAGTTGTSYVAVTAPPGGPNPSGTVYVSRQVDGGAWSNPPTAITEPSAQSFGIAVAFAGNGELLVGDPTGAGQVLVYSPLADGGWASAGTLPFSLDAGSVKQFGNGIAAFENLVVVTAPGTSNDAGTYHGAAFLFASSDAGVWAQETVLTGSAAESFGNSSPAINGAFIAVGSAINTATSGAGQVDVWAESGGKWLPVPSTALVGDSYYGQAVGIVGSTLFVGDTSANGAATISEVTSTLLIYTAVYADAGPSTDSGGGESDASSSVDGVAPGVDGSEPPATLDAGSGDSGANGTSTSSRRGCSCTFAGEEAGGGALAILAESALAFLACARRRRSRLPSRG